MRLALLLGAILIAVNVSAQTPASQLLTELQSKREMLPGIHQEFEVTQATKANGTNRGLHREVMLDMSKGKWRERSITGFGDRVRIFDGQDLFVTETDSDEYVRTKHKAKSVDPEPGPYGDIDLEWAKATEVKRQPCGLATNDHVCVIVDVPVKKWMRVDTGGQMTRLSDGISRIAIDRETGVFFQSVTQEVIETPKANYEVDRTYSLKRISYGTAPDESLFKLPENGIHEVKEFTPWNAARVEKELVGKPAPELGAMDMEGKAVSLADLKGKTVLLDFWTTWCPPCIADAPSLDKLYKRYGGKDLMIIGISVSEERGDVEKFLKKHPHSFPVVLTSENDMPRPYQIGIFPTYMVIAPDGTLSTAVQGDQGFGELRQFLEKAGMEAE